MTNSPNIAVVLRGGGGIFDGVGTAIEALLAIVEERTTVR